MTTTDASVQGHHVDAKYLKNNLFWVDGCQIFGHHMYVVIDANTRTNWIPAGPVICYIKCQWYMNHI
jgi:hypothetical protein